MESKFFFSYDEEKLNSYEQMSVGPPKAIVQIVHGMGEHAGRYKNLIEFLSKQGFIVFASDHRAHGGTSNSIKEIGMYEKDIFYDTVKDQIYISEYLIEKYNLPLIILGHSFGSFIVQRYAQLYKKAAMIILSGTSFYKLDPALYFGKLAAGLGTLIYGKNRPAKLIGKLTFSRYNKKFSDNNWLTSNKEEQEKQKVDRYLNKAFSHNFYKYFFRGIIDIYRSKNMIKLKKSTSLLIISGEEDILHKSTDALGRLDKFYRSYGIKNIQTKIYKGARHEVLNEVDKDTIYKDLLEFIDKNLNIPLPKSDIKQKEKKQK